MTSAALMARPLPSYTRTEEFLNSFSHALGALFGIFVLITCVNASVTAAALTGSIVYGASIILLYAMSSIYHGADPANRLAKQILRIADHCTIFVLIAGTYTPVCMIVLGDRTGWLLLAGVWAIAIVGIVINACWITCPKWFSSLIYTDEVPLSGWAREFLANVRTEENCEPSQGDIAYHGEF